MIEILNGKVDAFLFRKFFQIDPIDSLQLKKKIYLVEHLNPFYIQINFSGKDEENENYFLDVSFFSEENNEQIQSVSKIILNELQQN